MTHMMWMLLGILAVEGLAFGGGLLVRKAFRRPGTEKKSSNKDGQFVAAAMVLAGIALLGGILFRGKAEMTQQTAEAETEAATEAPTEAPTETPTEAPTELPTEAPTELETESFQAYKEKKKYQYRQMAMNCLNKISMGGFYLDCFSDNKVVITGLVTDEIEGVASYDDLYGSHETVTVPEKINGYPVWGIDSGLMAEPAFAAPEAVWKGVTCLRVPEGMDVINGSYYDYEKREMVDVTAEEWFAKYGITLERYDPDAETDAAAETVAPTEATEQEE